MKSNKNSRIPKIFRPHNRQYSTVNKEFNACIRAPVADYLMNIFAGLFSLLLGRHFCNFKRQNFIIVFGGIDD